MDLIIRKAKLRGRENPVDIGVEAGRIAVIAPGVGEKAAVEIDAGGQENVPAPKIAIDYWGLEPDARLREVVIAVRADEAAHRDTNHDFADQLAGR